LRAIRSQLFAEREVVRENSAKLRAQAHFRPQSK
jgi:hypothetical protein